MLHFLEHSPYKLELDPGLPKKNDRAVYHRAVYDWLMTDLLNIQHFLSGEPYYFTDFKKDDKGNLISCRVTTDQPTTRKRQW